MKHVVLVAAFRDGLLLLGKRTDNGRWTLPGGHVEDGEALLDAARRELKEETGLEPEGEFKLIDERMNGDVKLTTYRCRVTGKPSGKHDPDEECALWSFFDIRDGMPKAVAENMAGPKDPDKNVAADVFGLEKREDKIPGGLADKKSPKDFDQDALAEGVKVELEHTSDHGIATEIAMDHLTEDKDYYKKLKTIEKGEWPEGEAMGKMAIGTIPKGKKLEPIQEEYPAEAESGHTYDYSHVLAPEHQGTYSIRVTHRPAARMKPNFRADLIHSSNPTKVVASVVGFRTKRGLEPHVKDDMPVPLRGQGLGRSLYEAMYAHAYHSRVRRVGGSIHSNDAANIHESLARRHGLTGYKRELLDPNYPDTPYPNTEYSYALKGEIPMAKMAVSSIPLGASNGDPDFPEYNYDHVLSPEHRASGYSIQVEHSQHPKTITAFLTHSSDPGKVLGKVRGEIWNDGLTPHSNLDPAHRGKGLGQAMYEAVYAHAFHNGIKMVSGGPHSEEASHVHMALSDKHGHEYAPAWYPDDESGEGEAAESRESPHDAGHYRYALKGEVPMTKAEEHDEIDRMLMHPNPAERRMALKLQGVGSRHLIRALAGEDPEIQRAALHHPSMGSDALMGLMQMPDRTHLQLLALHHPDVHRGHLEALYHTHKGEPIHAKAQVMRAIGNHHALDPDLIEQMVDSNDGHTAMESLHTPPHVLRKLVEVHVLDPDNVSKRVMARRALVHPNLEPHLAREAFKNGPMDIKLAIAHGPHLPEDLAHGVLLNGLLPGHDAEAHLRAAIVQHPQASERHIAQALKDRNAVVRRMAGAKTHGQALHKVERWLSEQLLKATHPRDFAGITRASDPAGRDLVNHKPDLEAHPPEHQSDVAAYRQHVLDTQDVVKRIGVGDRDAGITHKLMYKLPAHHPTHAGAQYMVKPYHERIIRRIQKWGKHPHQGWAEMTNQALYHAGNIGHLHQKVHVAEHNMGPGFEREPALVVRMEDPYDYKAETGWMPVGEDAGPHPRQVTDAVKDDAHKIALMDFLTNNLDRHGGNLLYKQVGGGWNAVHGHQRADSSHVMAIDHSRSFQYRNTHEHRHKKMSEQPRNLEDTFEHYAKSAVQSVDPFIDQTSGPKTYYDRLRDTMMKYKPAFDWWGEVSPRVRAAFSKRLEQIQDPKVRAHLQRNFDARADYLDERADNGLDNYGHDWYKHPVPVYRPGELTDEEKDHVGWYDRYGRLNMTDEEKADWMKRHGHLLKE